jgi:hypothetical protein
MIYENRCDHRDFLLSIGIDPSPKAINVYLKHNCDHSWGVDWIDCGLEDSKKIIYCLVCETSK